MAKVSVHFRRGLWPLHSSEVVYELGRWCVDGIRQRAQIETAYELEFGQTWEGSFQK